VIDVFVWIFQFTMLTMYS